MIKKISSPKKLIHFVMPFCLAGLSFLLMSCSGSDDDTLQMKFSLATSAYAIDSKVTTCSAVYSSYWGRRSCDKAGCLTYPPSGDSDGTGPWVDLGKLSFVTGEMKDAQIERTDPADPFQITGTYLDPSKITKMIQIIYIRFNLTSSLLTNGKWTFQLADKQLWTTWRMVNVDNEIGTYNPLIPSTFAGNIFGTSVDTDANRMTGGLCTSQQVSATTNPDNYYNCVGKRALLDWQSVERTYDERIKGDCNVILTAIPISDTSLSGTITGTALAYGILTERGDEESVKPIFASAPVSFTWQGIPK